MSTLFVLLLAALILLVAFLKTPPAVTARFLTGFLPVSLIVAGIILFLFRQAMLGSLLLFTGLGLWRRLRGVGTFGPTGGSGKGARRSSVRSTALEMELDHDTGAMNGIVLVGTYEGRELESMSRAELLKLRDEVIDDGDSLALLDAYLDRGFAGWRENADADLGAAQAGPAGTGPMGEEEAYEVLGLAPGASASDIRQAHRRLMKSAHPDSGGSTFLAAKINEAKDILLRSHS